MTSSSREWENRVGGVVTLSISQAFLPSLPSLPFFVLLAVAKKDKGPSPLKGSAVSLSARKSNWAVDNGRQRFPQSKCRRLGGLRERGQGLRRGEKNEVAEREKWVCSTGARGRTGPLGGSGQRTGASGARVVGGWGRGVGGGVGPTETGRDRCEYSAGDGASLQLAAAGSPPGSSDAGRYYG